MIEFKKLTLDDIGIIKPYFLLSGTRTCDNTVGGSFMWRDFFRTEYAIINGTMFFKVNYFGNRTAFSMPLGADVPGALAEIHAYCRERNTDMLICTATDGDVAALRRLYDVTAVREEDWSDYIYPAAALAGMTGHKYNGQRNHMNFFRREHPDYSYREINDGNIAAVRAFFEEYAAKTEKASEVFLEEEQKVFEVLDNYGAYAQDGLALYADGKIVAFAAGEVLGDTLYVHIEKADASVRGAYQMTVSGFASHMLPRGILYVNREEDVGDAGLRTSKLSYHPCTLIDKYTVTVK